MREARRKIAEGALKVYPDGSGGAPREVRDPEEPPRGRRSGGGAAVGPTVHPRGLEALTEPGRLISSGEGRGELASGIRRISCDVAKLRPARLWRVGSRVGVATDATRQRSSAPPFGLGKRSSAAFARGRHARQIPRIWWLCESRMNP
jgi:hypothetical protein